MRLKIDNLSHAFYWADKIDRFPLYYYICYASLVNKRVELIVDAINSPTEKLSKFLKQTLNNYYCSNW